MLHYLDINRHIWEVNFRQTRNPPKFTELDGADQAAAVYVAKHNPELYQVSNWQAHSKQK